MPRADTHDPSEWRENRAWWEEREQGVWYMPDDRPQLPLMYSLLLRRPA